MVQGGYNDATSAAAAAREYYLQAKLASEAAERWAQGHCRLPTCMPAFSEPCSQMYQQMYTSSSSGCYGTTIDVGGVGGQSEYDTRTSHPLVSPCSIQSHPGLQYEVKP